MMKSKRTLITEEIVGKCLKNTIIKEELLFISLLGSSQTNEAIDGYSDLDILLILKSDISGAIKESVLLELRQTSESVSNNGNVEVSLLTHTLFDFERYVDFNYLIHYSWGQVLFGSDKAYKELFDTIIKKKYSEHTRKELTYYNLIHARFNLIRQYVSWNQHNKEKYTQTILKLIIDKIIEICDWALVYRGIFKKTKKDILHAFNNNFQIDRYGHIPNKSYEIRNNWNSYDFTEKELYKFIDESVLFVQELIRAIHEEHSQN